MCLASGWNTKSYWKPNTSVLLSSSWISHFFEHFGAFLLLCCLFSHILTFFSGVQKYFLKDVINTVILSIKKKNMLILRELWKRTHCPPIVTLALLIFIPSVTNADSYISAVQPVFNAFSQFFPMLEPYTQLQLSLWSDPIAFSVPKSTWWVLVKT